MTLDSQAASPAPGVRGVLWRRRKPTRLIHLTWPAVCAWAYLAAVAAMLRFIPDNPASPSAPPRYLFLIMVGFPVALAVLSLVYALLALLARAPNAIRVLATALNLSFPAFAAVRLDWVFVLSELQGAIQ